MTTPDQPERETVPVTQEDREGEDAAWFWLESKWLNVEAGDDPNDRDYSVDEMVDAFMAGRAATPATAPIGDSGSGTGKSVSASVYEAAVKGRQDFRQAYRDLLPVQRAAAALCLFWRTPGERMAVSDAFADALSALDVAVCGGGKNGDARPKLEALATSGSGFAIAGEVERLREEIRVEIVNTPETADFMAGVPLEAAHQRERWAAPHDAGKTPFDWFWLIGYLAQKAATAQTAGDLTKAQHHTISTGAALANWHAQISGLTDMRPGIGPDNGGQKPGSAFDMAAALAPTPQRTDPYAHADGSRESRPASGPHAHT